MKVRIITGYKDDQQYVIDADEAHKAYYLFRNPDKRGIFLNGLALTGRDIRAIVPDWHATMGWNQSYKLTDEDWNRINHSGVVEKMNAALEKANIIGYRIEQQPELLHRRLSDIPLLTKQTHTQLTEGINKL